MKRYFLSLVLSGVWVYGFSQQNKQPAGITFFEGSWHEALGEAKKQNKMVFVDVYTDWCAPCKVMDKHVFTLPEVGEVYNSLFINYKINAEKGEGKEIAKKFGVNAYPTFLFTDTDGFLVEKIVGEKDPQPFMLLAQKAAATGREKSRFRTYEETFEKGNRDQVFLKTYLEAQYRKNIDNTEIINHYFKQLNASHLYSDTTLIYLSTYTMNVNSPVFQHVVNNYDKLPDPIKTDLASTLFNRTVRIGAAKALKEKQLTQYNYLISFGKKLAGRGEKDDELLTRLDLMYSAEVRNYTLLREAGYSLAERVYEIPEEEIRKEDSHKYAGVMAPFLSGEKDSTQVPGFEEEKQFIKKLFTLEVTEKLYTAARHFALLPREEHQAAQNAILWMRKCVVLYPENKAFTELLQQLESRFR